MIQTYFSTAPKGISCYFQGVHSNLLSGSRSFSSSSRVDARLLSHVMNRRIAKPKVNYVMPEYANPYQIKFKNPPTIPDYKYGAATFYKQSDRGLYGGRVKRYGNQISEFRNHSRRFWKPNVLRKRLWSESLNRLIKLRVVAVVLKTIDKEGGLDNYLTKDKPARIKELGMTGWKLRYEVLQAQKEKQRKLEERIARESQPATAKIGKALYYKEYREYIKKAKASAKVLGSSPETMSADQFIKKRKEEDLNTLIAKSHPSSIPRRRPTAAWARWVQNNKISLHLQSQMNAKAVASV